jgi:ApbE superfamily uncharacterized protein (UPF0280 family)
MVYSADIVRMEKWVKENKDLLIDIAAIGGAIVAGLACTAVTAGVGAIACMAGTAALINLAKDAAKGEVNNWGDVFGSLGTGALTGLAGGVGGIVGGKIAGALATKAGSVFAGGLGGRVFGGAVSGGVGDAVTQFASTRQRGLARRRDGRGDRCRVRCRGQGWRAARWPGRARRCPGRADAGCPWGRVRHPG